MQKTSGGKRGRNFPIPGAAGQGLDEKKYTHTLGKANPKKKMSNSETATSSSTSSSTEEDEWAPPGGRRYVEHTRRVYGGGTVPWASGLEGRASAAHGSAVATRELDAAQTAMAQAYDAFNDALDAHLGDDANQEMLRGMIVDFRRVSARLKELTARVESDPYYDPHGSWHNKSRRWGKDNLNAGPGM